MRKRNLSIPVLLMIMLHSGAIASWADEKRIPMPLRHLLPNESRWFRGFTFKVYRLDQSNTLFDSTGNTRPNPNPELEKYELSLDLSKVFWSSDELVDAYKLAASTKKAKLSLIDAECFREQYLSNGKTGQEVLAFFARAQKGRGKKLRRFASAWTFSMAQSERQNPGLGGDDYEGTYSITFDPKKLIVTADRALKAYEGLDAYTELHKVKVPRDFLGPNIGDVRHPSSALRKQSGLPIMKQGFVALIPTMKIKSVDQFDFLAVGSTFLPNPLIEGSLETVTFTWDLSTALDTAKKRRDAMKAIVIHEKLLKRLAGSPTPDSGREKTADP